MNEEQQLPEEENFAALFAASLEQETDLHKGTTVRGTVVSANSDAVVLDVGAKVEGMIDASEFPRMGRELPAIGDEIEAMVIGENDRDGLLLSALAAQRQQLWTQLTSAYENQQTVECTITAEVKGGFRVDLGGLMAFMPGSECDPNPRSAGNLVGTRCTCAVLEVSRKPDNIVVSRKRPMLAAQQRLREAFFNSHQIGDKITATVRRMVDFGAFVDVGGLDALLHIGDISWRRINHPSEVLSIGQSVNVEITKMDPENAKVSVSMRSLQEDPWLRVTNTYEENMRVTGTVLKLLDFGAVVELEPGVEGLIHKSEMSWLRKDVKPTEVLAEGDVVDVAILEIQPEARRIRLSLKEVADNPWESWLAEHPVGSRVTGKIRNIKSFGFFVGLAEGMDGLVHLANISWSERGEEAIKNFHKGQEVEVVVLGVDAEQQRISLGLKQTSEDPFDVFLREAKRGVPVKGVVSKDVGGALLVTLANNIQARLAKRELPRDMEVKEGDEIEAKIIDVNRRRRQIELSVRQLLRDQERDAVRQYTQKSNRDESPSPLAVELQKKLLSRGND